MSSNAQRHLTRVEAAKQRAAIAAEARRKERADAKRSAIRALIDPFREHASIVLDALLADQDENGRRDVAALHDDIDNLIDVALRHARERFPQSRFETAYMWRGRGGGFGDERGDVYCRFCGELQLPNMRRTNAWRKRGTFKEMPWTHLAICALKHLAFDLDVVTPGTMKLPIDSLPNLEPNESP